MKYTKRKLFDLVWNHRNESDCDERNDYVLDSIMVFDVEHNINYYEDNGVEFDYDHEMKILNDIETAFNELEKTDPFYFIEWQNDSLIVYFRHTKTRMDYITRKLNHTLKQYGYKVNKNSL